MPSTIAGPRTEKTLYHEQSAWIKRPEKGRSDITTFLHSCIGFLLPTVLQPTSSAGGMEGLLEEANRLKVFFANSVPVPQVLEITDNHIVLSDCGPHLRHVLKTTGDRKEVLGLLERATSNLAQLHSKDLVHGRPHLKDMTLNAEGNICFLDLEEDPVKVMGLDAAQARDIWLFLSSCAEFCQNPHHELEALLDIYRNSTANNVDLELRKIARSGRPFRKLVKDTSVRLSRLRCLSELSRLSF